MPIMPTCSSVARTVKASFRHTPIVVLYLLLMSEACSSSGSQKRAANAEQALLAPRAVLGLELRAALREDTIALADRRPVEVVYVVANGPSPTPFVNDPTFFVIKVEDFSGRLVSYTGEAGPVFGSWGAQTRIVLPARAILAQVEDLRCLNDAGYARAEEPLHCVMSYNLGVVGSYRVIVEYHGFEVAGAGQVLADTVPLVVR